MALILHAFEKKTQKARKFDIAIVSERYKEVENVKKQGKKAKAVPQNEAHKTVLRDEVDGPEVHFISSHQPGEPKKPAKELIEEIQANHSGPGWAGDSVEREWSEAMLHFVKCKIETLAKEGFEKFKQNWLLIYDNWSLPALDREKAAQFLLPKIIESNCFDSFGSVFIITGDLVCEFSNTGIVQHEINNLWK